MPQSAPQRLRATSHYRPWGTTKTEPWFRNPEQKQIGEVWFAASDSVPLLVKLLFTSDNLSVQVHPEDEYAKKHHGSAGKTEMWHILRAEPGAQLALGLKIAVSEDELREACLSGAIVEKLNWVPARAGDTFFTPAGTIHAIGAGITLCEVQQLSDITYRLYDWGRQGRELHLDHGVKVSHRHAHIHAPTVTPPHLLAECQYFRTHRVEVAGRHRFPSSSRNTLYIVLEGEGAIPESPFVQGEAWEVPAGEPVEIRSERASLLITAVPEL